MLSISLNSVATNTNTATVSKESVSGNKLVKVTKVKIQTVSSLKVGNKKKLKVTITPSNASNKNVTWKSSNSKVATVDKNGNVKAIAEGTVKITATAKDGSGKKASVTIKVSCDHKNTESVNIRNPHGSSGHEATIRCKLCKKTIKKTEVENHKFSAWKTTQKSTCNKEGKKIRTCKCGYSETNTIKKSLNHKIENSYEIIRYDKEYHTVSGVCSICRKTFIDTRKEKHNFKLVYNSESKNDDSITIMKRYECICKVTKVYYKHQDSKRVYCDETNYYYNDCY